MKHKSIGIKDIAKHAGVSTGPVDKVLNNRGGVSKATRQRILQAIKELEYTPNILASRLKSAKEYTIAVLLPEATDEVPYWEEHHRGLQDVVSDIAVFGLAIEIFSFNQNDNISFSKQISIILSKSYDGVFMVPVFEDHTKEFVSKLKERKIPVIFFDTQIPSLEVPFIGQHTEDSGYLAAEILYKCLPSLSDILIVTLTKKDDNHMHFKSRENGFRKFFKNKERSILNYKNNSDDEETIKSDLKKILLKSPEIKGIFVTNGIHRIASILPPSNEYTVIGYDLIQQNIEHLNNGIIDFLISQRPYSQANSGIRLFYDILIKKETVNSKIYLPMDIVMKSNLKYYCPST